MNEFDSMDRSSTVRPMDSMDSFDAFDAFDSIRAPTRARSRGFDRDGPLVPSSPLVLSRSLASSSVVAVAVGPSTVAVRDDARVGAHASMGDIDGRLRASARRAVEVNTNTHPTKNLSVLAER
jgi:hypothetical protein